MVDVSENTRVPDLEIQDWGCVEYRQALSRQQVMVEERIAGRSVDRLVLVEHPPVITIGRSGTQAELRVSEDIVRRRGISVVHVERGGLATFHGPGQLVAYPIIKLEDEDTHLYLEKLLYAAADVLAVYGLHGEFKKGRPGIWVGSSKIASVGIAVRNWVTYHGIALNVNADPRYFDFIVPCGHPGETITSMEREAGRPLDIAETKRHFIDAFCRRFNYTRVVEEGRVLSRHPAWLHLRAARPADIDRMEEHLCRWELATVCQSAHCPNLGECFSRGTATFMILGAVCTRMCGFCAVDKGIPQAPDPGEPERVALAAKSMGLAYVVVTSVTRDDLTGGGAEHFAKVVSCIRGHCPGTRVEVLIPDFKGSVTALKRVCDARPDMVNHNVETVRRLYPLVRPQADYRRSLDVLHYAARRGIPTKSGMMLGLGETSQEIMDVLLDLRRVGCSYVTLGQYLAPSRDHVPIARYVAPEEFERWGKTARAIGFKEVASGPLVRSSYLAEQMLRP